MGAAYSVDNTCEVVDPSSFLSSNSDDVDRRIYNTLVKVEHHTSLVLIHACMDVLPFIPMFTKTLRIALLASGTSQWKSPL